MNDGFIQPILSENDETRSLLDKLISDTRLYRTSRAYKALLDFTVKLRNFAPFNAMLLHVQKPGLSYAASAKDWRERFDRYPKEGARPLLIMQPFGPVALVYDVLDTEGKDFAPTTFFARGPIDTARIATFASLVGKKRIAWHSIDWGDYCAGSIRIETKHADGNSYRMNVNKNHSPAVQFSTLTHELGHLFMGHLGPDKKLKIPLRSRPDKTRLEFEAESVSYIVCARNDVESRAEAYLHNYVDENTIIDVADIYRITVAAGAIESMLKLGTHTSFEKVGY